MSKWARWQQHEYDQLKILIDEGLTNVQIAEIMGRSRAGIQIKSHRVAGGNPNYRKIKTRHAHLREPVFKYFQKHTWEKTRQKFGLTQSELKTIFTVGYKSVKLSQFRKDTRTHDKWTTDELLFLLRHAGLQQRDWIAKKIKRGNSRVIKEKLMNLGVNTRYLNGMTLSRYRLVFGREPRRTVDGKAGPTRGCMPTRFKIVPWTDIERDFESGRVDQLDAIRTITEIMARFQRWIHGGQPVRSLKLAAGRGHRSPEIKRTFFRKRKA